MRSRRVIYLEAVADARYVRDDRVQGAENAAILRERGFLNSYDNVGL